MIFLVKNVWEFSLVRKTTSSHHTHISKFTLPILCTPRPSLKTRSAGLIKWGSIFKTVRFLKNNYSPAIFVIIQIFLEINHFRKYISYEMEHVGKVKITTFFCNPIIVSRNRNDFKKNLRNWKLSRASGEL